jgi:hypothetical protein
MVYLLNQFVSEDLEKAYHEVHNRPLLLIDVVSFPYLLLLKDHTTLVLRRDQEKYYYEDVTHERLSCFLLFYRYHHWLYWSYRHCLYSFPMSFRSLLVSIH